MPSLSVNGVELHYEETGSGPETIVFAHGLLMCGRMFDAQVAVLKNRYRCITFDFRGHGRSAAPPSGYDMETLTEDTAALIQVLGAAPCHFVGLSMGGFIGMRLAIRRPELIRSLVLMATSADAEPQENVFRYKVMNFIARWLSVRLVSKKVLPILFGPKFLTDPARAAEREAWLRHMEGNNRTAIARAAAAVRTRLPVYDEISGIRVPTVILVGDKDSATVPAKAQRLHDRIPHSRLVIIPDAGHSSSIEEPAAVNAALTEFLGAMKQ